MSLGFGILGFLNYTPMSGYDLVKAFESSLAFFWHAQNSHIYLELKKLEKNGFICGETVIQSERPNKTVFTITDAGRKAFLDWLAEGEGESAIQFKSVFLMKVFFSGNIPPAQSIEKLRHIWSVCNPCPQVSKPTVLIKTITKRFTGSLRQISAFALSKPVSNGQSDALRNWRTWSETVCYNKKMDFAHHDVADF